MASPAHSWHNYIGEDHCDPSLIILKADVEEPPRRHARSERHNRCCEGLCRSIDAAPIRLPRFKYQLRIPAALPAVLTAGPD